MYMGSSPSIGYRSPVAIRGMRKDDGLIGKIVFNLRELEAVSKEKDAAKRFFVRIGGTVGEKKRIGIRAKCKSYGLAVSN